MACGLAETNGGVIGVSNGAADDAERRGDQMATAPLVRAARSLREPRTTRARGSPPCDQ